MLILRQKSFYFCTPRSKKPPQPVLPYWPATLNCSSEVTITDLVKKGLELPGQSEAIGLANFTKDVIISSKVN